MPHYVLLFHTFQLNGQFPDKIKSLLNTFHQKVLRKEKGTGSWQRKH